MSDIRFDDRVAIVTGAGGGVGRAHALELARRGAKLVVNDLGGSVDGTGGNSEAAEQVVAEIEAMGGQAIANGSSVTDDAGVKKMIDDTMDANSAASTSSSPMPGILRDKSFSKMTLEDFQAVVDVHLMGSVKPFKAAWEIMKEQRIWPSRRHDILDRALWQFRPGQLRRRQARPCRADEHAEDRGRETRHQGQCCLPNRGDAHDRRSDCPGLDPGSACFRPARKRPRIRSGVVGMGRTVFRQTRKS